MDAAARMDVNLRYGRHPGFDLCYAALEAGFSVGDNESWQ